MPYTNEEGGRLNNFASEPKMYVAEPPSGKQKTQYALWAAAAAVLVGGLVFVAVSASQAG
ncbi:photosystem II assembly protein Psb34 [Geitlerinema sp. PCC 7407]|uniref:photosystem II assembly protein Psb34 n=1 Tax=Geitlerinema sp. PCC 7407 TaxID=1173025 RepID=UPI00029FB84B|nr:ssl1498 family light-harvesting-like protein [Geitlerinema sp. PCC 7407]AFY66029.1 hypothetical protein GEI7407_1537 [Geitlerinema sp. PCC 7407]